MEVLRSACLCEGKTIGIEYVFRVAPDGSQINIPENLAWLRKKSRERSLYCPCGCGNHLILVAGDRGLRTQHFRMAAGSRGDKECTYIDEGEISIRSKILLASWLERELEDPQLQTRVPICMVNDSSRKYEFSFLSQARKIAVSYNYTRSNISQEKLDILESNRRGIAIIYIEDGHNSGGIGQFPEYLMRVQEKQGYCLYLLPEAEFKSADLMAAIYVQDQNHKWIERRFAFGNIKDFHIDHTGQVSYRGKDLRDLQQQALLSYQTELEQEREKLRLRAEEEERQRKLEEERRIQAEKEREAARIRAEREREEIRIRKEEEQKNFREEQLRKAEEAARRRQTLKESVTNRPPGADNSFGNRSDGRIECTLCGKTGEAGEFITYKMGKGLCKECKQTRPAEYERALQSFGVQPRQAIKREETPRMCPRCFLQLVVRNGRNSKFYGCPNYPACKYTENYR